MILYETAQFELPPSGVHVGRLFKIVDHGTQPVTFNGEIKLQRKLSFTFELLGDERMADGQPYAVTRRFTASLSEKGALRPFLESWRGRKYTPEELRNGLPLAKLLGHYGLLTLIEAERDGKRFVNIAGIAPLPKGVQKPEGVNPPTLFMLDEPDTWDAYDGFSDRLKEIIAQSPEGQRMLARRGKPPARFEDYEGEPAGPEFADMMDDIPY